MIPIGSLVQMEYSDGAAAQYGAVCRTVKTSDIYVILSLEEVDVGFDGLVDAYKLLGPDGCIYYCELGWPTKFKVIALSSTE